MIPGPVSIPAIGTPTPAIYPCPLAMHARDKHVVLVTHSYPPSAQVSARRPRGFAKYLSRLGYEVTVLTSSAFGRSKGVREEDGVRVAASGDLITSRLNWRRGNIESIDSGSGDYDARRSPATMIVPPDPFLLTWVPYANRAARHLASTQPADCVITTSPPDSTHLVARHFRRRGAGWIADVRDGWMFQPNRGWPLRLQERLDARMERRVMLGADAITTVTEPISEDIRRRYGADVITINNGYDPDDFEASGKGAGAPLNPDRHSLVYTGRFAYGARDPGPLIAAMRRLGRGSPELLDRIEVVLAGPLAVQERAAIDSAGLGEALRHVGSLPRAEALALQRAADTLLLVMGAAHTGAASAKLYEYLAAERPILVIGSGTEAARIVAETGAGSSVEADDPTAIAESLGAIARGKQPAFDLNRLRESRERYAYPRLAERLSELVERVLEERAAQT